MIMRQTSPRSRWPCSRPPIRARLEFSQPCSAFFFGGLAQGDDHLVDVVLEVGDLALGLHGDPLGQVAAGHRRGHLGDRPQLGGQGRGELVDVVGQVAPGAGHALHLRLAAELALGADLAADPGRPRRRRS